MKILVLASNYPSKQDIYNSPFIHSRCLEYKKYGHDVQVLSFLSKDDYCFEDIQVFSEKNIQLGFKPDLIMAHAPNRTNHLRVINKMFSKIPLMIYFHGHEIMKINKHYPEPFEKNMKKLYKVMIKDFIKLFFLKSFLIKKLKQGNLHIVFVSEWMRKTAFDDLKLNKKEMLFLNSNSTVIANPANSVFLNNSFQYENEKIADFITIRPFDNPKYAIDIVYKVAKDNPKFIFHVYGEGTYFDAKEILANLKVFKKFIVQKEIPKLLNKYKYALMPTRLDSQGVMMCEIASYGMPIFTSDIPICHEMLDGFKVAYIQNSIEKVQNLSQLLIQLEALPPQIDRNRFNASHLIGKELEIADKMLKCNKLGKS